MKFMSNQVWQLLIWNDIWITKTQINLTVNSNPEGIEFIIN